MSEGGPREPTRDPAAEAAVQRMLADAGGPEPMPPEVAARLDDVLLELAQGRAQGSTSTAGDAVVELRARRRWPRLLLAAAAVVVGGYGVGTVLTQGTLSGSETPESAMSTESGGSDTLLADEEPGRGQLRRDDDRTSGQVEERQANKVESPGDALDLAPEATTRVQGYSALLAGRVRLRSDELETDVRRALRVLDREPTATLDQRTADAERRATSGCPASPLSGRERALPVRYDGERAVLVAGPERDGVVEVTVHDCSGTEIVTTLVRR